MRPRGPRVCSSKHLLLPRLSVSLLLNWTHEKPDPKLNTDPFHPRSLPNAINILVSSTTRKNSCSMQGNIFCFPSSMCWCFANEIFSDFQAVESLEIKMKCNCQWMESITFWPALFVHIKYPRHLKVSLMPSQIIFLYYFIKICKASCLGVFSAQIPSHYSIWYSDPLSSTEKLLSLNICARIQTIATTKKLILALKTNEYVRQIVSGESKHIKTGYQ